MPGEEHIVFGGVFDAAEENGFYAFDAFSLRDTEGMSGTGRSTRAMPSAY
jgi:hypothetical protein